MSDISDLLDEIKSVRRHISSDNESSTKLISDLNHGVTDGLMKERRKSSLVSFNSDGTNGHMRGKEAEMDVSNVSSASSSGSWKRGGWKLKLSSPSLNADTQHRDSHESEVKPTIGQMSGPLIVHCNSGAGRTGVLLLTEIMIYCLEHNHVSIIGDSFHSGALPNDLLHCRKLMYQELW